MHEKYLNLQDGHKLHQTKMESKVKKSEDYDLYYHDEFDAEGNLVSKYIIKHSISIYPPFGVYIEYQKFDINGKLVEEKRVWRMNNKSVAEFMISEIVDKGHVCQEYLVHDIQTKFGDEYVYINENGNLAISKKVLNEFKKLKEVNGIEWDRSERCWTKD